MSIVDQQQYNAYMAEYMLRRYHERRAWATVRLGGACVRCGTTEGLEFDHIEPQTKELSISKIWSYSWKRFVQEVDKCQLLCHEHHLEKSRANGDLGGGHNRVDDYDHGSGHAYNKDRCRCDRCREWKRAYRAKEVNFFGTALP